MSAPPPAGPSPRLLEIVRDHPSEPVAIDGDRTPAAPPSAPTGCGRFLARLTALLVATALTMWLCGVISFPTIFALIGGLLLWRGSDVVLGRSDGGAQPKPAPVVGLPTRSHSGRPLRLLGPAHQADRIAIDLDPRRTPRGGLFEPGDPEHLEIADLILACRRGDGLGFVPSADGPRDGSVVGSVVPLVPTSEPLLRRLDPWVRIAGFLETREYPHGAWLAAIACRESRSVRRAVAALDRLTDLPGQGLQIQRIMGFVHDRGHWCARAALAIRRASPESMDQLIAEAPAGQVAGLICLVQARWGCAPDPAVFGRWVTTPEHALALADAALPDAGEARWRPLLAHADPAIVGVAARRMLTGAAPLPAVGARGLLGRADIRRLFAEGSPPAALSEVAAACIDLLAHAGGPDDVRLLGRWSRDPTLGAHAERSRVALLRWVGSEMAEDAGGLALASADGASGGLSPAAPAGALSADDEPRT